MMTLLHQGLLVGTVSDHFLLNQIKQANPAATFKINWPSPQFLLLGIAANVAAQFSRLLKVRSYKNIKSVWMRPFRGKANVIAKELVRCYCDALYCGS